MAPGEVTGRSILSCEVGNGKPIMLCSLHDGLVECANHEFIFDEYTKFSVEGARVIHLSGYCVPEEESMSQINDSPAKGQNWCCLLSNAYTKGENAVSYSSKQVFFVLQLQSKKLLLEKKRENNITSVYICRYTRLMRNSTWNAEECMRKTPNLSLAMCRIGDKSTMF
jgi:hypothetical protein